MRFDAVSSWYKISADRPRADRTDEMYSAASKKAASEIRAVMTVHTKETPGFQKGWELAKQAHSTVEDFIELATLTTMYNIAKTAEREYNAFKLKQPFTLPTNKDQKPCRDKEATECMFVTIASQFYTGKIKEYLLARHATVDAVSLELDLNRKLETIAVNTWYVFTNAAKGFLGEVAAPSQPDDDEVYLDDYIIQAVATTAYAATSTAQWAYNNGPLLMGATHILVSVTHRNQYGVLNMKPVMYSALMIAGSYGIEYMVPGQFTDSVHTNDQSLLWVDENGQYTVNRAIERSSQLALDYARPAAHIVAGTLSVGAKLYGVANAAQHNALKIAVYLTAGALYESSSMYHRGLDYGSYRAALSQGGATYAAKLAFYDAMALGGFGADIVTIYDIRMSQLPLTEQRKLVDMVNYLNDQVKSTTKPVVDVVSGFMSMIQETNAYSAAKLSGNIEAAGEAMSRHSDTARSLVSRAIPEPVGKLARQAYSFTAKGVDAWIRMFAEMARLAGVPFERIKAATLFLKSSVGRAATSAGQAVGRAAVSAGQATGRVAVGAGKMAFDNLVYVTDQIMNAVAGEPPSKRDARLIAILNAAADPSGLSEVDLARLKVIRKRPGYKWSDYFEDDDDVVDIKPIPFSKRAIPVEDVKEGVVLDPNQLNALAAAAASLEEMTRPDVMLGLAGRAVVAEDVGREVVIREVIVNMMDVDDAGMPQVDPQFKAKSSASIFDPVVEDVVPKPPGIIEEVVVPKPPGIIEEVIPDPARAQASIIGEADADAIGGAIKSLEDAALLYLEDSFRVDDEYIQAIHENAVEAKMEIDRAMQDIVPDLFQEPEMKVQISEIAVPEQIAIPYPPVAIARYVYRLNFADADIYALFNDIADPFAIARAIVIPLIQMARYPYFDFYKPPQLALPEPPLEEEQPIPYGWGRFNLYPEPPPKPGEPEDSTRASDRITALRPFFPIAGEDVFTKREPMDIIKDEHLRATNAELGMIRPTNWPKGSVDNPVWIAQQIEKDRRFYGGPLLASHAFYSGGTMTDGDTLYGTYR